MTTQANQIDWNDCPYAFEVHTQKLKELKAKRATLNPQEMIDLGAPKGPSHPYHIFAQLNNDINYHSNRIESCWDWYRKNK